MDVLWGGFSIAVDLDAISKDQYLLTPALAVQYASSLRLLALIATRNNESRIMPLVKLGPDYMIFKSNIWGKKFVSLYKERYPESSLEVLLQEEESRFQIACDPSSSEDTRSFIRR